MATDLLKKAQPSHEEAIFAFVISAIVLVMFVHLDSNIHDFYNREIQGHCHPENQDDFCKKIRNKMGLPPNAQLEIGDIYAATMLDGIYYTALIVGVIRLFMGLLAKDKHYLWLLAISVLWGFTAISLFSFGWSDWGYYFFRGMPTPEQLAWLDDVGFFQYVKVFGPDPLHVDKADLALSMVIGIAFVAGIWALLTHHYRKHVLRLRKKK